MHPSLPRSAAYCQQKPAWMLLLCWSRVLYILISDLRETEYPALNYYFFLVCLSKEKTQMHNILMKTLTSLSISPPLSHWKHNLCIHNQIILQSLHCMPLHIWQDGPIKCKHSHPRAESIVRYRHVTSVWHRQRSQILWYKFTQKEVT